MLRLASNFVRASAGLKLEVHPSAHFPSPDRMHLVLIVETRMQGDVKKVTDDVVALKPSIFAAVPRVLDRMKSGIEAKIKKQPGFKQAIFRVAYNIKRFTRRLGRFDFVSACRLKPTHAKRPHPQATASYAWHRVAGLCFLSCSLAYFGVWLGVGTMLQQLFCHTMTALYLGTCSALSCG